MREALLGVGLVAAPGSHVEGEGGGERVGLQGSHCDSIAQPGHLGSGRASNEDWCRHLLGVP